jgi:predicted Zn-dependent peptidase
MTMRRWAGALLMIVGLAPAVRSADRSLVRGETADRTSVRPTTEPAQVNIEAQPLVTEFDVKGLKVLLKRRAGSQTVAAGLFLRGGARNLTPDTAGVEALMLQVATEATTSFPRERLRRELASTGTSLGAGVTYDFSVVSLAATRQGFDRAWTVFTDAVLHPSFTADDVERVRTRMLAGLKESETVPESLIEVIQERTAYAGHPYQNDPHGTVETIGRLTLDDLKKCHQQMLQTSRLLLVVVGDLEPTAIQPRLEAAFGALPRGTYVPSPVASLAFSAPAVQVTAREIPVNYVKGVYAAPSLTSPDIYPLRVATSLLESRVFEEVRVKRGLSYAPEAFLDSQGANIGGISFSSPDPNQVVTLMLGEIQRLQTVLTRPDEIQAVAQQFLTKAYLQEESSAAQAGVLAQAELIGGGWRRTADVMQRLREVTPADVRRVATTYMRNLQFVAVGNPRSIDPRVFTQQK